VCVRFCERCDFRLPFREPPCEGDSLFSKLFNFDIIFLNCCIIFSSILNGVGLFLMLYKALCACSIYSLNPSMLTEYLEEGGETF